MLVFKSVAKYFLIPAFASAVGAVVGGLIVYFRTRPKPDLIPEFKNCNISANYYPNIIELSFHIELYLHNYGTKVATLKTYSLKTSFISYDNTRYLLRLSPGAGDIVDFKQKSFTSGIDVAGLSDRDKALKWIRALPDEIPCEITLDVEEQSNKTYVAKLQNRIKK